MISKYKKIFIKWVILIAYLIFAVIIYRTFYYIPSDEIILPKTEARATTTVYETAYPTALSIPKININTKIQQVGITQRGNMATPNNFIDVGWYKYGTIPGDIGSAVIAGHVNNELGLPAVFSDLKNLKNGDDIYITTEKNIKLHFIVTKINIYDYDTIVEEVFNENNEKILKLITCTGNWIDKIKTHNKRLVVSAILVE